MIATGYRYQEQTMGLYFKLSLFINRLVYNVKCLKHEF